MFVHFFPPNFLDKWFLYITLHNSLCRYDIQIGIQDPYDDCVATMRLYMRMKSQAHKREDYPLASDPQNRNNFASWRQTELERMSPEEMLAISRSDYYCWCLDRWSANGRAWWPEEQNWCGILKRLLVKRLIYVCVARYINKFGTWMHLVTWLLYIYIYNLNYYIWMSGLCINKKF